MFVKNVIFLIVYSVTMLDYVLCVVLDSIQITHHVKTVPLLCLCVRNVVVGHHVTSV
jgi:hypothetical protein